MSRRRRWNGATVLTVSSLNITGTGSLDLSDNSLIVDYSVLSPIATIQSLLKTAFNAGAWNGHGIRSSLAKASTFALGCAEASDVAPGGKFSGQNVDATAVVLKFTRYGDANLDGAVNFADLVRLAQHFNSGGARWAQEDFDYDDAVGFPDLVRLAQTFNSTTAIASPLPSSPFPPPAKARNRAPTARPPLARAAR